MAAETLRKVGAGALPKGDVLATARLAGIQAAKRTSDWIPLCHSLPLDGVELELTPVELEVLQLVSQGLTNREIAERLRWSVGNVKKYVQRILDKLAVSDRTQAAVEAVRRGLVRPPA